MTPDDERFVPEATVATRSAVEESVVSELAIIQSHRLQLSRNLRDSPGCLAFVPDDERFVPEATVATRSAPLTYVLYISANSGIQTLM